jgi:N-methylhydantoinase A/oxoprolinase/acetone carboxylase beta subunit
MFHQAHTQAYGFAQQDNSIEIVNLRVTGFGTLEGQTVSLQQKATLSFRPTARRRVWTMRAGEWCMAQAYVLGGTSGSNPRRVHGPSVVDLPTSTLLVPPDWVCSLTDTGDLVLTQGWREWTGPAH